MYTLTNEIVVRILSFFFSLPLSTNPIHNIPHIPRFSIQSANSWHHTAHILRPTADDNFGKITAPSSYCYVTRYNCALIVFSEQDIPNLFKTTLFTEARWTNFILGVYFCTRRDRTCSVYHVR